MKKGVGHVELAQELRHGRVVGLQLLRLHEAHLQLLFPPLQLLLGQLDLVFIMAIQAFHLPRVLGLNKRGGHLIDAGGSEKGLQTIEVALRDRIVLVIVTLAASCREPQKNRGRRARDFIQKILTQLLLGSGVGLPGGHAQKA